MTIADRKDQIKVALLELAGECAREVVLIDKKGDIADGNITNAYNCFIEAVENFREEVAAF